MLLYLSNFLFFLHLADAFIQSDLQCIKVIIFFVSMCVPWESNPQPLRCKRNALPLRHRNTQFNREYPNRLFNVLHKSKTLENSVY